VYSNAHKAAKANYLPALYVSLNKTSSGYTYGDQQFQNIANNVKVYS
jgi:hypothetical protein